MEFDNSLTNHPTKDNLWKPNDLLPEGFRNEWKYPVTLDEWYGLEQKLKRLLPLDENAEANGKYTIHSLYFDDIRNGSLLDNDAGQPVRKKFRIRYYRNAPETLHLECKEKFNGRCRKLSCPISTVQYEKLVAGRAAELLSETDDPLLQKFCLCFLHGVLTPKAIIDYERTAYVEEITDVRITLDEQISVSDRVSEFLSGNYVKTPLQGVDAVLEVKFDYVLPGYLARVLSSGFLQESAFSKYYRGRLQLRGAL